MHRSPSLGRATIRIIFDRTGAIIRRMRTIRPTRSLHRELRNAANIQRPIKIDMYRLRVLLLVEPSAIVSAIEQ